MDKQIILDAIEELENSDTTFDNVQELASLYTVYHNLEKPVTDGDSTVKNDVTKELSDILPSYQRYCELKRQFQTGHLVEVAVINSLVSVCTEIEEFISTLFSGTDLPEERQEIIATINKLYRIIK